MISFRLTLFYQTIKSETSATTGTPVLFSPPVQPSDSGIFCFYAKPLVVKGFAKQYPIPRILRREPLPGGLAHDFNEKRPKFSGRLEQATSPRRSPENRLNEKHTPSLTTSWADLMCERKIRRAAFHNSHWNNDL